MISAENEICVSKLYYIEGGLIKTDRSIQKRRGIHDENTRHQTYYNRIVYRGEVRNRPSILLKHERKKKTQIEAPGHFFFTFLDSEMAKTHARNRHIKCSTNNNRKREGDKNRRQISPKYLNIQTAYYVQPLRVVFCT